MDRSYTLPCQKASFSSCEGCPKEECHLRHYPGMEPQQIIS